MNNLCVQVGANPKAQMQDEDDEYDDSRSPGPAIVNPNPKKVVC
jgi:hypothetical protein